jgi:hypothetical protein
MTTDSGRHIDVLSLATSTHPSDCSQCSVRYMRLGPLHHARWLVQWHPGPQTNVWLTCDTQLAHVLNGVHETWAPGGMEAFLAYVRLAPPAPVPVPVVYAMGMRAGETLRSVEALREALRGDDTGLAGPTQARLIAEAEAMHANSLRLVEALHSAVMAPVPK